MYFKPNKHVSNIPVCLPMKTPSKDNGNFLHAHEGVYLMNISKFPLY